jgi:hypothetical protein
MCSVTAVAGTCMHGRWAVHVSVLQLHGMHCAVAAVSVHTARAPLRACLLGFLCSITAAAVGDPTRPGVGKSAYHGKD